MTSAYYFCIFVISVMGTAVFMYMWHKHLDVTFTIVFTLILISCLGYILYSQATVLEEAIAANKIIYIGGSFLQLFILLNILNLCQIEVRKWLKVVMFLICCGLYGTVLSIGYSPIFYSKVSFEVVDGTAILHREYGFMHTVFMVVLCLYFLVGIIATIYSLYKKSQIPRRAVYMVLIPALLTLISYFAGRRIFPHVDLIPVGYVLAEIMYILIAHRVTLYNVSDTVIDSMVRERAIGYVSFDLKYRYLGSNEVAKMLMPDLRELVVDKELDADSKSKRKLLHYMKSFSKDKEKNKHYIYSIRNPEAHTDNDTEDLKYYKVEVDNLYLNNIVRGFLISFTDDTPNQKYIRLLDNYKEDLEQQVQEKTDHIVQMHNNLIMSMAMMVESRDNSTGGHIMRTSENVRILIDEIVAAGTPPLQEDFCKAIVKAAPMHDLGKIAVDDAVLRKPGRFTPEEFEEMKQHAAKGAQVIHEILLNTDDERFKVIAENVAHYHHERWDGSGYPEGLAGEDIPIEARIMAIADVYDALVSKRVYKDAMSFEKADSIILEGMGSQFDPSLQSVYEKARPRLEAYYISLQGKEDA